MRPRQESIKYVNISHHCYGHSYIWLYRELGTVRPQQESIKFINTSHHHANVLTLCSLLYFSHMHTFVHTETQQYRHTHTHTDKHTYTYKRTPTYMKTNTHTRTDNSWKTVHFCTLALGSRAWCARIPDNSSLVHLEKGVRERSKEKRRSVVEDLGRWAGETQQQREKGAQNGAQPSWQRALCRLPFGGFGQLSGLDEAPYREKPHGEVHFAGFGHPQGQHEPRDALPRRQWA